MNTPSTMAATGSAVTTSTTGAAEEVAVPGILSTVKQKHRAMWASGDYPAVADVIADLGPRLVDATAITAEDRVIDVAAGAGNVAIPAARTGADVVATDLTPKLLDVGRAGADVGLTWCTADAEDLPFGADTFDVAVSCVGVMFAPDHQRCADELVRVVRPGGRIGLINWTPSGFIGELFTTMKPYLPAPGPGAVPGIRWGDEAHVRGLFGDRLDQLTCRTERLVVSDFADGAAFRDFFKATYGPTIAAFTAIGDDSERACELDAAMAALAETYLRDGRMEWEYLLVTGTVR